ncbi:MAG: DNA repair exonuclease, partial [Syntrophorhabdus sp.]
MMFKFIHAADIHLDSPLRGLSRYESAPAATIRNASRKAFETLVDRAIEENAAFILLAGDLYDGDWKDYSTGIFLSKQLGRLKRHNIPVFAVAGNHDAANRMTKTLDVSSNMTILSPRKVETIKLDALNVAIHGRSFGPQHESENIAKSFPAGKKDLFNIGILHTSLNGREGHAVYAPCSLDDLRATGYQYWALGHIHQQEIVCEDPYVVFPGCIQGRHIRETGPKGCVLVTIDDNAVTGIENVPLDVVRWALCRIDVTDMNNMSEIFEKIRMMINDQRTCIDGRTLAMRIVLEGATPLADALAAYPERLDQQLRAIGAEASMDDVWIERIENNTTGKRDISTFPQDSAYGKLLNDILAIPDDPASIPGFDDLLADLRQKIPVEA